MARAGRRLRGRMLRLARNRPVSIMLGVVLAGPAAWLLATEHSWETPATDGFGLILGATGAALLIAGIGGRQGDWVNPEDPH